MNIQNLVVDGAGQQFDGKDFLALIGPGVYVFLFNGLPIYVGMSRDNLLGRASSNGHHQSAARSECDQVKLFPCKNWGAACDLEDYLIEIFQPKHNKRKKITSNVKVIQQVLGYTENGARGYAKRLSNVVNSANA